MKTFFASFALLAGALLTSCNPAHAQTLQPDPDKLYAAGVSYNPNGVPGVAGTALAVKSVADGTYVGAAIDALPTGRKPFTVTTQIGPVIARKVFSIGSVPVWAASGITVAYAGPATGWGYNGGLTAPIRVKETPWFVMPTIRFTGNSATGSPGVVQPIATIMIGYGR